MPALPQAAEFTGTPVTEPQFKAAITDLRQYLADLLGEDGVKAHARRRLGAVFDDFSSRSSSFAITADDAGNVLDLTAGGITVTLPAATSVGSQFVVVLRGSSGPATVQPAAGDTVDGMTTVTLEAYQVGLLQRATTTTWTISLLAGREGSGALLGGTNANGLWLRSLDGTQWVSRADLTVANVNNAVGGGFASAVGTFTYPMPFVAGAAVVAHGHTSNQGYWVTFDSTGTASVTYRAHGFIAATTSLPLSLAASGRWK